MKILIIDDEQAVISSLKRHLKQNGWEISSAKTYDAASYLLLNERYDIIICDHLFPQEAKDHQGLDLIRDIRKRDIKTPVIILTGCDINKIKPWEALDIGVDDFIRKPYYPEEIIARIKALCRRTFPCENNSRNMITHCELAIDIDSSKVFIKGKPVHLSNTLFRILKRFMKNIGNFVSYEDFIKDIWGENALYESGTNNTLRVHIRYLRKALGNEYGSCIKTIHGRGFIWEDMKKSDE